MQRETVESLDTLLQRQVAGKKIVSVRTSRLTAPGENYGGLLLRLDVTVENSRGVSEELHVIAKCIPTNAFLQNLFNIQVSVKKEIAFYDTVVPLLQQFQRESGVENVMDFYPTLYAARINLNGSDVVDENAAIILENLVHSGYRNVPRSVGFDLETIRLILKNLATFHAVPLALRRLKPEYFENKIKPYLIPMRSGSPPLSPGSRNDPQAIILEFLDAQEEFRAHVPALRELLRSHWDDKNVLDTRPFFTITHGDMWGNNIMVKFENDKAVASKFVDFQNYSLRSSTADLLFLLLSSVQFQILGHSLDDLITFYHEKFVENLIQLKCDPTPFSFENLLEEIRITSRIILSQIVFMVSFVIFAKEGGFSTEDDASKPPSFEAKDMTDEGKERVLFIVRTYKEKGWL